MRLKLAPDNTKIPFLSYKKIALGFSLTMMVLSIVLFFAKGLNMGIDFEGGILIEVGSETPADLALFRSVIANQNLGDSAVQTFGSPNEILIRIERQQGDEGAGISDAQAQQAAVDSVQRALEAELSGLSFRRVEFVGPKVSGELVTSGILSVVLAVMAVLIYIWMRFEWHFGVGAVAALVHDVVLTIGLFSLLGLEFNLSIIAAILTIVGYSLNDTVVVFDRVRENLRKYRTMPLEELLDFSLNSTLSRTLMTSVTTLIALFSLFIFGGAVIHGFTAAMIWGIFVGTYSSVFIASPVLVWLDLPRNTDQDSHGTVVQGQ
jgi:preprotein translocase subunit SecF